MADFTPTQGRYLAFIHAYANLHGRPPAESEIATAMCVSPPSVNQMVKNLEKRGLILRQPGQPRSLQVLILENEVPPVESAQGVDGRDGPGRPAEAETPASAAGEFVRPPGILTKNRGTMSKKPKRKLTAAEKRARRERKKNFMIVFINGKQKRVPRPSSINGLPADEFIARNADPLWLHQNEMWELMPPG
jgi:hypothetical protein